MESSSHRSEDKFVVFRSFVDEKGTIDRCHCLVKEALNCHHTYCSDGDDEALLSAKNSKTSIKLELGILCGGDLSAILPLSVDVARRAYQQAANLPQFSGLQTNHHLLSLSAGPLSGICLLYGLNASMSPHYDSPTQMDQREEWLVMITLGNSALFRCNHDIIELNSGDVLVMDSMAVLHGVEGIVEDTTEKSTCSKLELPFAQSRLGILFWKGRDTINIAALPFDQEDIVDGINELFETVNE